MIFFPWLYPAHAHSLVHIHDPYEFVSIDTWLNIEEEARLT